MTHSHSDEIKRILERRSDAYAEFLSATLLLKKALEAEEMAAVTRLIERRAGLIGVVDGLDREIVRNFGDSILNSFGIKYTVPEIPEIPEILSANRDCAAIAADRLSLLRKELKILHEKEEGLHGYIRNVEQIPKFLNVRT